MDLKWQTHFDFVYLVFNIKIDIYSNKTFAMMVGSYW